MDDDRPDTAAEGRMRQSLGLSDGSSPPVADDPQRSARHAIRSQAAARDYAERQLARAEQTIQDLRAKFHAVRREKAIAIEAARAAHDAQAQAERGRRAAEAALINEKAISNTAQREAPLCQRSCRLNRVGTFGGADSGKWLDTDKRTKIG